MVTRFFDEFFGDIIFREEDVVKHATVLPGDCFKLDFNSDGFYELFLVRVGEDLIGEGEE